MDLKNQRKKKYIEIIFYLIYNYMYNYIKEKYFLWRYARQIALYREQLEIERMHRMVLSAICAGVTSGGFTRN